MKASSKRALSLLLSAALLVGALFIYATFIRPEYSTIQELRGIVEAKAKLLEETKNASANIASLKLGYQKDEKIIESLSLALPEDEAVSSLMAQLNALSQTSGLVIQSVGIAYLPVKSSPNTPSFAKKLGTLKLDLKLFGNYAAFNNFLQNLENNIRIMDVKNLKLSQESKTNQDLMNYGLTIDAYYQIK